MKYHESLKGFTLPELMIVIAIVAIITTLAIPAYTGYVRKANRGEALQLLMNWANLQEIWRSNHSTYASALASPNGIPVPTHEKYTFSVGSYADGNAGENADGDCTAPSGDAPNAIRFKLAATATGGQAGDTSKGTDCDLLTISEMGVKCPVACWE